MDNDKVIVDIEAYKTPLPLKGKSINLVDVVDVSDDEQMHMMILGMSQYILDKSDNDEVPILAEKCI